MDIKSLTEEQFTVVFNKVVERIKEDPIENFVKAKGFMDLTPSSAQEVILKVIFQKPLDPVTPKPIQIESTDKEGNFIIVESTMTEVEIYEYLTDKKFDADKTLSTNVNKIDLLLGRRSGKTLLTAIVAIYSAISTNWKPFLSKTPFATALIMSHSREFSDEVLDVIKQLINESPILTRLINHKRTQSKSTMNLIMPFLVNKKVVKSQVQIKVGAASSKTTRGIAACVVIADEICWWGLDENMKESDYKVMKAVRPALKQFGEHGMLLKLSSPAIKLGVLYDEYKKDREGTLPESYAVFKAPSWVMNTFLPKEEFVEEWRLDPDGFDTEYRANFTDSMSNFISPESIDLAVMQGLRLLPPSESKDIKYFAAIDAAFKGDRFTFSVVGITENRITQYISKGWEGSKKDPVRANEVAAWISNTLKDFPVEYVAADQYSFQPLCEIFDQYNVTLKEYTFSPTYKKKIYFNLKNLLHRQQLDLLANDIQTKELKELVVEQSATGTIKIGHPVGGTDDFADSLAVATHLAVENQSTGKFTFDSASTYKTYGIRTNVNGVALTAPSPDMLVASGHLPIDVVDNSGMYGRDPEDGIFKHLSKFEGSNDEEGFNFCFG